MPDFHFAASGRPSKASPYGRDPVLGAQPGRYRRPRRSPQLAAFMLTLPLVFSSSASAQPKDLLQPFPALESEGVEGSVAHSPPAGAGLYESRPEPSAAATSSFEASPSPAPPQDQTSQAEKLQDGRRPPATPRVCTSFLAQENRFGMLDADEGKMALCGKGEAFFAEMPLRTRYAALHNTTGTIANCCPLPPDALLDEHKLSAGRCPDNYVATGITITSTVRQKDAKDSVRNYAYRCTAINTERYQLGPPRLAIRISTVPHGASRQGWLNLIGADVHITTGWHQIPPGLRFGILRTHDAAYEIIGCTGYPWGSPLVGRNGASNCGFDHSELLYKGAEGDPPAGSPVQIFPDCIGLKDPFGRNPVCITRQKRP